MRRLNITNDLYEFQVQFHCYKSLSTLRQWLKRDNSTTYNADIRGTTLFYPDSRLIEIRYTDDNPLYQGMLLHETMHAVDFIHELLAPGDHGPVNQEIMESRAYLIQATWSLLTAWHAAGYPDSSDFDIGEDIIKIFEQAGTWMVEAYGQPES